MRIISLNVAELQPIPGAKNQTPTGIFKKPVEGPVVVHKDGLEGDHIGSVKHHGGPDQAVYVYSAEDYAWWEGEMSRELPFGTFGENVTVSSFGDRAIRVGDLWQVGSVTLELTAPRIPCSTLAARMNDPGFVKAFAKANRGGVYARVLSSGSVDYGQTISVTAAPHGAPTIDELFEEWHRRKKDPELLRRALASPLAEKARESFEKWLARCEAAV